jgi:hypothetical protein
MMVMAIFWLGSFEMAHLVVIYTTFFIKIVKVSWVRSCHGKGFLIKELDDSFLAEHQFNHSFSILLGV